MPCAKVRRVCEEENAAVHDRRESASDSYQTEEKEKNASRRLWSLYAASVQTVERRAHLEHFGLKSLTQEEFCARPQVLLLGQYSTGKTSMIKWLTGAESPHFDIRPQPSTDKFMAIVHGETERIIHGNAATCLPQLPYRGLTEFGNAFLEKFQALVQPSEMLSQLTFVDTPGVLSGRKQKLGRDYEFTDICKWMAQRSDLIIFTFDAHKLDISDEFKEVMQALRPYRDKVRCVLNKADQIDAENLVRVYGALLWNVGVILQTPEVARVYISSFWDQEYTFQDHARLFDKDKDALKDELNALPGETVIRRINTMVARIRRTKAYYCLVSHLRSKLPMLPSLFRAGVRRQRWLVNHLPENFAEVQKLYGLSSGDMPETSTFRERLAAFEDFGRFPVFEQRVVDTLDRILAVDIPQILNEVGGVTASALSSTRCFDEEESGGRGLFGFFGGRKRKNPDTLNF